MPSGPTLFDQPAREVAVAVLDLEMTGLDIENDRVIEVAVVRGRGGVVDDEYQSLVKVKAKMSPSAAKVHGITLQMLENEPGFAEIAPQVNDLLSGAVVICHNVPFDIGFLHREMDRVPFPFAPPVTVDTLIMARRLFAFPRNNLSAICEKLEVVHNTAHRALSDARATHAAYTRMVEVLDPAGDVTIRELIDLLGALAPDSPYRLAQKKLLRTALRKRETVKISYHSTATPLEGLVEREIAVWRLKLPYIQGWCYLRQGERVFRLDRIRSVEPAGRTYEIPDFRPRI